MLNDISYLKWVYILPLLLFVLLTYFKMTRFSNIMEELININKLKSAWFCCLSGHSNWYINTI